MAEIGFPLFFLLVIGASIFAIARALAADWERITAALDGRLVAQPSADRVLTVSVCQPIDLPYVARRMGRAAPTDAPRAPAQNRRKAA